MTVSTQAANTHVFFVVHEKKLLTTSGQTLVDVFSPLKPKRIDCFLLSTTVFLQLLINNFDDTWQNLGSMTKRHPRKQSSTTFCIVC